MPGSTGDHSARDRALAVEVVVLGPAPCPRADTEDEPLRVTVVAADPGRRRRLVDALAGLAAVEVVGWADSAPALALLDRFADADVAFPTSPRGDGAEPSRPRPRPRPRVELSPRQVEVLVGYAAGNELLGVVARRLGMSSETLKTHLRRIRGKYAEAGRPSPTRRDLYVRAVEDGFLTAPC